MMMQNCCLTLEGKILKAETNRIYRHIVEGTRESHQSGHDLQSTTRLAESWMLQIIDMSWLIFSPTPFIFNK